MDVIFTAFDRGSTTALSERAVYAGVVHTAMLGHPVRTVVRELRTSHPGARHTMSITTFAAAVVYTDDVARSVEFYTRATGLEPSHYDRELGFALLGEDQAVAIASHAAGALMLADGYDTMQSARVSGTELAFWAADVPAAYQRALEAGAVALTPPRLMPWGQTVAYVQAPEGTIVGFITRMPS